MRRTPIPRGIRYDPSPMTARDLIRLAGLHGIQTSYRDGLGNRRRAPAATLEGVLQALDVDTGDPAASLREATAGRGPRGARA